MKKLIIFIFVFFILLPCCFSYSLDSPDVITIEKVLPGGYAEESIELSAGNEPPFQISVSSAGIIKDWISVEPSSFDVFPSGEYGFKVTVNPPENASAGVYEGFIILDSASSSDDLLTSSVSSSKSIKLRIEITNDKIIDVDVPYIDIKDTPKDQPVELSITIDNRGNSPINPLIKVDILNEDESIILRETSYDAGVVLPSSQKKVVYLILNDFGIGTYRLSTSITMNNQWMIYEQTSSFKVYDGQIPEEEEPEQQTAVQQPVQLGMSPALIILLVLICAYAGWRVYSIKKNKK